MYATLIPIAALIFTLMCFVHNGLARERHSQLIIHPGADYSIAFDADIVQFHADNWLDDCIRVDVLEGVNKRMSYELSKSHPIRLAKRTDAPHIQVRFVNGNMLDFTVSVVESWGTGHSVGNKEMSPQQVEAIVSTTPGIVVSSDQDIQMASQFANLSMPIRSSTDYELSVNSYSKHKYYMGRLEVKLSILSRLAGMQQELQTRMEITRRYVAGADQGHMVPPIEHYLAGIDIRLDPEERFARELYNAYLQAENNLQERGNALFKSILLWIATTREIASGDRQSEGVKVYRRGLSSHDEGVYDMGGMGQVNLISRKFGRDVLVPIFEKAKTTKQAPTPEHAAVSVISFLSALGQ